MNKYIYYRVIQSNWFGVWEDVDFHECDSTGWIPQPQRGDLRGNLRAYRENEPERAHRVITRRELRGAA